METTPDYDVLVIGAGAVGVAVAREMTLLGKSCAICEKEPYPLSEASSGNTGHLATNFYYTPERGAPIEAKLTRLASKGVNDEWLSTQKNVPRKRVGSLHLASTDEAVEKLDEMLKCGIFNGEVVEKITDLKRLEEMEPNVNFEGIKAALWSPKEYVVDPFLLPLTNLYSAMFYGCELFTTNKVAKIEKGNKKWLISIENQGQSKLLTASILINCAGNYSDEVDKLVKKEGFCINPAKGEYVIFEEKEVVNSLILQIPTKTYAGPYLFQTVYGHLACGPTKITQKCKRTREICPESQQRLESHARSLLRPSMQSLTTCNTYCGLRPQNLANTDYELRFEADFATLGAIRSTGLTSSRAIAIYTAKKFFPNYDKMTRRPDVVMPKPTVDGDSVMVGKFKFKITHMQSRMGLILK